MRFLPFLLLVLLTKSSYASYDGLGDELRFLHQEIGSLRAENQKKNMEIASLKDTVQLQNKTINQHEATIEKIIRPTDDHRKIRNDQSVSSAAMTRRKRPARLLPASILYGKKKNETDRKLFFGPPTNCSDLTRLGYTLNGFYMIKRSGNDDENTTTLDAVYCTFKQEGPFNPSLVEHEVMPYPFNDPLLQNSFIHTPKFLTEIDVYFKATANINKKDHHSGVLTFVPTSFKSGNDFNETTGYFKASVNGIYHFSYEAYGISGNATSVGIYMNDGLVVNSLSSIYQNFKKGRSPIMSSSLQVTLKLMHGDTVCFKDTSRNNINSNSSYEPDSFINERVTGCLLKPTPFL